MKKLVALMLALVMVFAMAVPAFADATDHYKPVEEQKLTGDGDTGLVDVTYEVSAKWQIVIPADVTFVETYGLKFFADVSALSARIPIGQTLTLSISSKNGYIMRDITDNPAAADGVPYAISMVVNNAIPSPEPGADPIPCVIAWPDLSDDISGDAKNRVEAYKSYFNSKGYKTAGVLFTDDDGDGKFEETTEAESEILTVVGVGTTIKEVTTTMAFYTPGTDKIGTYKDTLTFTARLFGDDTPAVPAE